MKSILGSSCLIRRITLLLCSLAFFVALPVDAKDKHNQHGSNQRTHHYSPRYNSQPQHPSNRYYNNRPVYGPQYHRPQNNYRYSNSGNDVQRAIINQFLRRP